MGVGGGGWVSYGGVETHEVESVKSAELVSRISLSTPCAVSVQRKRNKWINR